MISTIPGKRFIKKIKTGSTQSSSNKCKNYFTKILLMAR